MRRFDFRLKSVLVLRQRLLSEAEEQYSYAIKQRKEAEENVRKGWREIDLMNDRIIESRASGRISGVQQQGYFNAIGVAKDNMVPLLQALQKALKMEQAKRNDYIKANRNHELLVKLKDKQQTEHLQEELLKEQQLQDDLFNARRAALNTAASIS